MSEAPCRLYRGVVAELYCRSPSGPRLCADCRSSHAGYRLPLPRRHVSLRDHLYERFRKLLSYARSERANLTDYEND